MHPLLRMLVVALCLSSLLIDTAASSSSSPSVPLTSDVSNPSPAREYLNALTDSYRSSNDTFEYHFVAFRFKNGTTAAQIDAVSALYRSLLQKCPYIVDMKGGLPNSKEGFQQSMDQGWVTIFRSASDRDYFVGRPITYPYDPFHDEFKAFVGPFLREPIGEGLIVVDFINQPFNSYNNTAVPHEPAVHETVHSSSTSSLPPIPTDPSPVSPVPILPRSTNDTFEYHFVAFRFNKTLATPAIIDQVATMYRNLLYKCPYIVNMVGGLPNSKEGFQQQMDQGWVTTFRSVADRDYFVGRPITYPYDPYHDAFKTFVGPYLVQPISQGLLVIDFQNVNPVPYTKPFVEASFNWVDYVWEDAASANNYYTSGNYKNVVLTGIKIWNDPRTNNTLTFVCFPRFKANVPATLGYINHTAVSPGNNSLAKDAASGPLIQPFPSWDLNKVGDATAIQSVIGFELDSENSRLWILDQGRVNGQRAIDGSIKLIIWDLLSNSEIQRYVFPAEICDPDTSFLNDIVLDTTNGFAYITDTGLPRTDGGNASASNPSLIVYDFKNNDAWRTLYRDPSTMPNATYVFSINGTEIYPNAPTMVGADGIALTPDGRWLFYTAVSTQSLYRVPTCALRKAKNMTSQAQVASYVTHVMLKHGNCDGMAFGNSQGSLLSPPITFADAYCSVDELSAYTGYQLFVTDISNSVIESITGYLPYATDDENLLNHDGSIYVNSNTLDVSVTLPADPNGATQWPDTIGFDQLGSLLAVTNHLQRFLGLNNINWGEANFRIWSVYIEVQSYMGLAVPFDDPNPPPNPPGPTPKPKDDSNDRLFYTILIAASVALWILICSCIVKHKRANASSHAEPADPHAGTSEVGMEASFDGNQRGSSAFRRLD